jgi:hypothetical protein
MTAMEVQYRDHEEQMKGIVKEKLAEHSQLMDLLSDVQRQRALQSSTWWFPDGEGPDLHVPVFWIFV